jgi:hypothetical protein
MDDLHARYARDGFVRLDGAIPPDLLAELRAAVEPALVERGRSTTSDTRHQTMLDPVFFQRCFLDFLNLPALNRAAQAIIGREDLAVGGLALLVGAPEHRWCGWHRDHGDEHPEMPRMFEFPNGTIQFNCALYDDHSLWVIPGSHRRPSTEAEREHVASGGRPENMPGAINVHLRAGDCLLYRPIIWHAAEYRPERKRATFHGGWTDPDMIDRFECCRWGFDKNPSVLRSDHLVDGLGAYFGPQLERWRAAVRRHAPALISN